MESEDRMPFREIPPFSLSPVDRAGTRHRFEVTLEQERGSVIMGSHPHNIYTFRVYTVPQQEAIEFYIFSVAEFEGGPIKIISMNAHRNRNYLSHGITPAMILTVSELFNAPIESSSNLGSPQKLRNEERLEDATRTWREMERRGLASYDSQRDVFILSGN